MMSDKFMHSIDQLLMDMIRVESGLIHAMRVADQLHAAGGIGCKIGEHLAAGSCFSLHYAFSRIKFSCYLYGRTVFWPPNEYWALKREVVEKLGFEARALDVGAFLFRSHRQKQEVGFRGSLAEYLKRYVTSKNSILRAQMSNSSVQVSNAP